MRYLDRLGILCYYILRKAKGVTVMSIAGDIIRGHTEAIILAGLLKGDSYGYRINKTILERSGSELELKEATLYTAFKRLEDSGFIRSYWGSETTGARRRYYSITQAGREEYERLRKEWDSAKATIDILIEKENNE